MIVTPNLHAHLHFEAAQLPNKVLKSNWTFSSLSEFLVQYDELLNDVSTLGWLFTQVERYLVYEKIQCNIDSNIIFFDIEDLPNRLGISAKVYSNMLKEFKKELKVKHNINVDFVPTIIRQKKEEKADFLLDFAIENGYKTLGLAGGSELEHPLKKFSKVLNRAKMSGLDLILHCGEEKGTSQQMWDAFDLGVTRIGHGVQAFIEQDFKLINAIIEKAITLDFCPISNEAIRVVETFPSKMIVESGVNYTINADDPFIFCATLKDNINRFLKSLI